MKKILASVLLGGAVTLGAPAQADIDPFALYGDGIDFEVLRNGDPVGTHTVRFAERTDGLRVISRMDIAINFLFFEAYSYTYNSVADWRDGRLRTLDVQVDDNGDIYQVTGQKTEDLQNLVLAGPDGETTVPVGLFPTNHWNVGVLGSTQVINTLTGKVDSVQIINKGQVEVETEQGVIEATHYAYTGDLQTEVWYTADGRWIKMRFETEDGSVIDYRCKRCGLTAAYAGS